jgi:serine protease AprX
LNDCPLCSGPVDPRLLTRQVELRPAIIALIQQDYLDWQPEQGVCPQCALGYAERFASQRSPTPLNVTTDPHTTFPYYHSREETVLSQPIRLPDHPGFDGRGVTIAFLDSGFYPHPDLLASARWPGGDEPDWPRLDAHQMRRALADQQLRIIEYVDLTDGQEVVGLEQESLWNTAGYSWHGQMTSVLAAGNGLLSDGVFRGYAPGANVLAIKIGRSDGRIPEADILAGLRWLLKNDHWKRYRVRVVNISVGGDYPQRWEDSELSLATEQLSRKGVLVVAAAGNSGQAMLLPPAQTPSVLTVGGYDDANCRWTPYDADEVSRLSLYSHNYGEVEGPDGRERKPNLLAPARYLPAPILPATSVFRETRAIGKLRRLFSGQGDEDQTREKSDAHIHRLLKHWHRIMHVEDGRKATLTDVKRLADARSEALVEQTLDEIWRALRKRMNAHKWVHDYYQHVDGTSVAAPLISAVAAQMFQANPRLTSEQARAILETTALDMPQWPIERRGEGVLQPAMAVAAALRSPGGVLSARPTSSVQVHLNRLRKWVFQGKVTRTAVIRLAPAHRDLFIYFGLYAPNAQSVSLIGSFNAWAPGVTPLQSTPEGWWQAAVSLPAGRQPYRFWVVDGHHPDGEWRFDPENPLRAESGYRQPHSFVVAD